MILALAVALLVLFAVQMAGRRGFRSIAAYCVFSCVPVVVGVIGSTGSLRKALIDRHANGIRADEGEAVFHHILSESLIALHFGAVITLLGLCGAAILAWKGSAKLVNDY
jgi:NADH:ubiquinone oxidoreductase subunit 6 (subunit J)